MSVVGATGIGTIRLRLDSDPNSVRLLRAVIRRIVDFPNDEDQQSLLIAVSEIFGNAVDEHVDVDVESPIVVTLRLGDDGGITIADRGRGIDHGIGTAIPSPEAADGRGLPIARALVPDLHIDTGTAGTSVTLPWPEGSRPSADLFPPGREGR